MDARRDEVRARAVDDLRRFEVVMEGHFDYGNGFHGRLYLNPHKLLCHPSIIWRVAQDLIDIVPANLLSEAEIVAGPVTGGALLAHTMAGLLDGRRPMSHASYAFASFATDAEGHPTLSPVYRRLLAGRRVLIADDVRNTGQTLAGCAALVEAAGGSTIATVEIVDRLEAQVTLPVPNVALIDYKAPANHPAASCPLCAAGIPVTAF